MSRLIPAPREDEVAGRLLITTDTIGGVWTCSLDLAKALRRRRLQVWLITLGPAADVEQRRLASAAGIELVDTGLPLDWLAEGPGEIERAASGLAEIAADLRVDLVHLNSPALGAASFAVPVVGTIHSCLATWWASVGDGPMPADFVWRTEALWRGLIGCRAVIAPSHAFAAEVARAYDMPQPFVAWHGRDHPRAEPRADRARLALCAGRLWDRGKNVAALDRAASAIDGPVALAGPLVGPSGERFQPRAARPLGALSSADLRHWMSRAAVFVSPSLYEPFGLAVLEAAQAGCALALADIPTFRELWDGAAAFFPPDDPHALARAVNGLIDDPAAARRMGLRARQRARRFDLDSRAEAVLDIYRLVSDRMPRRRSGGTDGRTCPSLEAAA